MIIQCEACEGTGHGHPNCGRNPYFGCEECEGYGEIEVEDEEE